MKKQSIILSMMIIAFACSARMYEPEADGLVRIPFEYNHFNGVKKWLRQDEQSKVNLTGNGNALQVNWQAEKFGHSKIIFTPELISATLHKIKEQNMEATELILQLRHDGNTFPMLETYLFFKQPRQERPWFFRLRPGTHEYQITDKRLMRLNEYQIRGGKGAENFTVEKIHFRVRPSSTQRRWRKMTLQTMRPTQEILPEGGNFHNFWIKQNKSCTPMTDNDQFRLKIIPRNEKLEIRCRTRHSTPPKSFALKRDDNVWADDCLELFFSPQLDNRCYTQFSINAKGQVYDAEFSYDPVATVFRHQKEINFHEKSRIQYEKGFLNTTVLLPLHELKFKLWEKRIAALQIGYNFTENRQYLSWNRQNSNLNPMFYGLIYFNRKQFGKGKLEVRTVEMKEKGSELKINMDARDFQDGKYTLETILTAPDHSKVHKRHQTELKNSRITLTLEDVKDIPGHYTLIVIVRKDDDSIRPFILNFKNIKRLNFPYGQKKLFPYPKQTKWTAGEFLAAEHGLLDIPTEATKRTRRTAELLQEKLARFGLNYRLAQGKNKDIMLRLDPALGKPEGYTLSVKPNRIIITGADEPGLYYGTVTLHQLMKLEMRQRDSVPVPCVEITDWPDLKYRLAPFWFTDQVGAPIRDYATMDIFLDYLERFAAGNKLNVMRLRGIECLIRFDHIPEINYNAPARRFTMKDLNRIADFCRDHFIEIIFALPAGGHDWWISSAGKDFRETGWHDTGNVENRAYQKIYFQVADEIIKATKCKYFTPESDEWWHSRNHKVPVLPELVNGKPRAHVYRDFHLKLHAFLKQRNIRMVMNEDMINPLHNGPRFDTWKIIDDLPRDIIMLIWADIGDATKYLGEKGFECWGGTTGWLTFNGPSRKYITGFGSTLYGFGREYDYRTTARCMFHNIWFMGANYAWNFNNPKISFDYDDMMNQGDVIAAECVFAERPITRGSENIVTLDIQKYLNAMKTRVTPSQHEICHIPTQISQTPKGNTICIAGKTSCVIPVEGNYASLVLLHNATAGEHYKKGKSYNNRTWPLGYPVAEYEVRYQDGTATKIPIRLNTEIYFEDVQPQAGTTVFCRGMDIRYDTACNPYFLYQYEWSNPFPEKEICELKISAPYRLDFTYNLFAVSARKIKRRK